MAQWQTHAVGNALAKAHPGLTYELNVISTVGDRTQASGQPLPDIGGKGLFTAELDAALAQGDIDFAVHSLKDLPTEPVAGTVIAPVLERGDAADVLVSKHGHTLQTLPEGAIIGTGSLRRQAQLLALRPDIQVQSVRGNAATRVDHALTGDYDAVVLTAAGLNRIDLQHHISQRFDFDDMLPAPGQAALAVNHRSEDAAAAKLIEPIVSSAVVTCVTAERALLSELGGGCSAPIGAYATLNETNVISLTACVGDIDHHLMLTATNTGNHALELAKTVADQLRHLGCEQLLNRTHD